MIELKEDINKMSSIFKNISKGKCSEYELPEKTWFTEEGKVIALPQDDGDSRYPYGFDGFNFWAYASGYMHSNEGIFSPFLRSAEGQEPKIAFFSGFESGPENEVIPLLAVPYSKDNAKRYTIFDKSYVMYITEIYDVRFGLRVYVTDNREMRFSLHAENFSSKKISFYISSYFNPFLLHDIFENGENRWFREVRVKENSSETLPSFIVRCNENLGPKHQVSNFGVLNRNLILCNGAKLIKKEETTSRKKYVGGTRSSLHMPEGVIAGSFGDVCNITTFTEVGICGDLLHFIVPSGGTIREDISFNYKIHCDDESPLKKMLSNIPNANIFDNQLELMIVEEEKRSNLLKLEFIGNGSEVIGADKLNSFFIHLKKQVEFCSLIKGYVQLGGGSLIGIRDVFQALEGYLIWQPEAAREKMLEALSFIDPSGRCPRQYSLPATKGASPAMDLRPFIDQGVWVISTIVNYLKFTDDFKFLNQICGYYEIIDEKRRQVKLSEKKDSVLEHMLKIMDWLLDKTNQETGCIRVLFGDWNDALDGLGASDNLNEQYGSGVSVMAASQVWQNLNEMIELLSRLDHNKYADLISKYTQHADVLEEGLNKYGIVTNDEGRKRICHGWGDKMSYRVGGWSDPDGLSRISLTSNAFWVLSGLYEKDKSMKKELLEDILSLDSKYGLKTFEPYFGSNVKGVGRITKLPPGTAENGAVYIHASAFGIMALFQMGYPKQAWKLLEKAFPITHEKISVSTFVMPNSYGFNKEKNIDGESMMDWQTGSSNVVLKLLVRFVAGIKPEYDGIWIRPADYCPYNNFQIELKIKGKLIKVLYKNIGKGNLKFFLNGIEKSGKNDSGKCGDSLWIPTSDLKDGTEILVKS